jgi:hypothetical protein
MAKTGIALAGFVVGLLVSSGAFIWVWIEFHPPTSEVWTSTTEIRLENGALKRQRLLLAETSRSTAKLPGDYLRPLAAGQILVDFDRVCVLLFRLGREHCT